MTQLEMGKRGGAMVFLVINIPAPIMPLDRADRFEDPLMDALEAAGIDGGVVGGGTALTEVDGRKVITSCDIELEIADLPRALPIIRHVLIGAGAPLHTTIRQLRPQDVIYRLTDGS
jgi:hypothetical protein